MLPTDPDNRHYFKYFKEISTWTKSFYCENGVNSFSTRYITTVEGNPYPMSNKQRYINPYKLRDNINKVYDLIIDYATGIHFKCCSCGDFSSHRIEELELALKCMERYKKLFAHYDLETKKHSSINRPEILSVSDIIGELSNKTNIKLKKELIKEISSLEEQKIFKLALGIRFRHGADVSGLYLKDVNAMGQELAIEKLVSLPFMYYKSAIKKLSKHIEYLKSG